MVGFRYGLVGLLQGFDMATHLFAVGDKGEYGQCPFVVFGVVAMGVGFFEEIHLRGGKVEGVGDPFNLGCFKG